jgi:hypothetical protein
MNVEVYVDRNSAYLYLPQEVSEDSPICQNIHSFSETLLQTEHDIPYNPQNKLQISTWTSDHH